MTSCFICMLFADMALNSADQLDILIRMLEIHPNVGEYILQGATMKVALKLTVNTVHGPKDVVLSVDSEGRYMTVDHVEIEDTGEVDLQQHPPPPRR